MAVAIRFYAHKHEYTASEWSSRLIIIALFVATALFATWVVIKPGLRRSTLLQACIIVADVVLISVAYWLTGEYGSDFFLFYYLPIFSSVEHLGGRRALLICFGIGVGMLIVAARLHAISFPLTTQSVSALHILLLRWLFLIAVAWTSAIVFRGLSRRQAELLTLLEALHTGAAGIPSVQHLDDILESILSELTDKMKFEFAGISLVDEYRNCIEAVRGRNISPGWILRARHRLDEPDIQTHVVHTKKSKIVEGWDDLLDRQIYERFEHWRLARIWAPIITRSGEVVGTIEAGCNRDRMSEVFTESSIATVERLGKDNGDAIGAKRPHILLQGIARHAIELIGADSATLHVYRRATPDFGASETQDWGDLILATGAGKATPEFVQSSPPRPEGMSRQAVRTGKPEYIHDAKEFESKYSKLYALGMRAMAVIPLKLGPDAQGILAVHYWRPGKVFTSREINLAELFASEMEGVIQDYLLLRRATEIGSRAWALSGLQSLMQSLTSPFSLPDVLKKIAQNVWLTLDADAVTVFQYDARDNKFHMPPVVEGQFINSSSGKREAEADEILFELIDYGESQFIVDVHQNLVLSAPTPDQRLRFIDREGVKSCAILLLRPGDQGEIVGLIFVNYRQPHAFSTEEKKAMHALASAAALAIRQARQHSDDLKGLLEAMHNVHAAIAEKGPDLRQVLERLLQQALVLTRAKYGVCMQWNERDKLLEPIASWPTEQENPIHPVPLGVGLVGLAAQSRQSILVDDVLDHNRRIFVDNIGEVAPADFYQKINSDTRCEMAVPLLDGDQLLGVLNVEHPEPGALTQDDRLLVKTLAVPAIIAFHTVDLYKSLERRIRHLSALNIVAARIQAHHDDSAAMLRLFLTGITAGSGLGFSRAMLFLAEGGRLRGHAAVGPMSNGEAKAVWDAFERSRPPAANDLQSLLQEAEQSPNNTPLAQHIREIDFSIDESSGAAAECLLRGKTVTVDYKSDDPFRAVLDRLTVPADIKQAFAAVPLVGYSGKVGVLVVDNRFLLKERSIDAEDITGLEAFAGLLALSIARVELEHSENQRLENWKEVTGAIAHTMGTLLFEVKGDLKNLENLLQSFGEHVWVRSQDRLGDVSSGLTKAEKVLHDFRMFVRPAVLNPTEVDLRQIVKDAFPPDHTDYELRMRVQKDPLIVYADPTKLGNALREICRNSLEAMREAPNGRRQIEVSVRSGSVGDNGEKLAEVNIQDNGPGFKGDVTLRLFEPYFTTKQDGTGLGLAIVKKIIMAHNGRVEANNAPNGGAVFTIYLPLQAAGTSPEEEDHA